MPLQYPKQVRTPCQSRYPTSNRVGWGRVARTKYEEKLKTFPHSHNSSCDSLWYHRTINRIEPRRFARSRPRLRTPLRFLHLSHVHATKELDGTETSHHSKTDGCVYHITTAITYRYKMRIAYLCRYPMRPRHGDDYTLPGA